ncbi:unnamed protein product [Parascedosporium putredinis]|uniref:ABC transporter domain-containing protein n=1 Tax=Parascedosporium putredinis TaxID=1442378 RepID=A0A9P1H3R3_9PEZI|nr:unnamed protein product [Parascedosporium putredinis]CAI7996055.1 unnamed protein product [Parascedosporium putredinis]
MAFLRQTGTLISKNFQILLGRHAFNTLIWALVVPIILTALFSFLKNLVAPVATFGIGESTPIRSLTSALEAAADDGRDTLVFVNNGLTGGDIDSVIDSLSSSVEAAGKIWETTEDEDDLKQLCKSSLRGYAVDSAVSAIDVAGDGSPRELPSSIDAFPFTSLNQEEYKQRVLEIYMGTVVSAFAVLFVTSILFITYHLAGFVVTERESGMIRLLDAMMPVKRRWHAQAARIISYFVSFSLIYLPGWVIGALIMRRGVYTNTSVAIVLVWQILSGLSMASMSLFASSFFRQAQLSANVTLLITVVFAILSQAITKPATGPVFILSLLFPACNYVYHSTFLARFEKQNLPANLLEVAPDSPWNLAGGVFWIIAIGQIIVFPLLGALIESRLYGTTTKGRSMARAENEGQDMGDAAVRLENFTKIYAPSRFARWFPFFATYREPVVAVDNLSLVAPRGQIVALLGANGSGKSTTLDTIAGMNKLTSGSIKIDGRGGLGIAPRKTFSGSPGTRATKEEIRELIKAVDLEKKRKALAKTLSGGQKRKLQLGMMLTGGSAVCCVDEVSSGIDPLSRRQIWDILLAERGKRTIFLTTHFLDEADLLADHIAILSKGTLRAEGSPVALKDQYGAGYRIHIDGIDPATTPNVAGVEKRTAFDVVTYVSPSSALAAGVIKSLEAHGIHDYRFSGPTIEDVFLNLAEEVREVLEEPTNEKATTSEKLGGITSDVSANEHGVHLLDGKPLGFFQQGIVLFRKRVTIFKTNWVPYITAFVLPVAAAGLVTLFIRGQEAVGCSPTETGRQGGREDDIGTVDFSFGVVAGPNDQLEQVNPIQLLTPSLTTLFGQVGASLGGGAGEGGGASGLLSVILQNVTFEDTFGSFKTAIEEKRKDLFPGGFWLGGSDAPPTLAFRANGFLTPTLYALNFFDVILANQTIVTQFEAFDVPWAPLTSDALQLVAYMCIALVLTPGFLALYPNVERLHLVRGLEYSNGVRPTPLWSAYTMFDLVIGILASAIITAIWAGVSSIWYHLGYIFLIFVLYWLASTLLGYVISLFATGQLATFGWVTGIQALCFVGYLIGYMTTLAYAPVTKVDSYFLIINYTVSLMAPIGSVVRAFFITLNIFSTTCDGDSISTTPGGIELYGGPILYLIMQALVYFLILVIVDSGSFSSWFRRSFIARGGKGKAPPSTTNDEETGQGTNLPLMVMNVSKSFKPAFKKKLTAVDDVSFDVRRGEVFALLGPNGAGKSTTISVIRGDIAPDKKGGDVLVEDKSVTHNLAGARSHLGVCPQFDPMDKMTVREHLEFYARVRGVSDVQYNVQAVLRGVGLSAFASRMAHTLSGGNKRKLSLGIALMGNPTVVLLDEPSSGLDAAAKRIMWKTLKGTVAGRSILLTTHSMEEADALAGRVGILAKSMLALGTIDELRARFGNILHVHLVSKTAPRTSDAEMLRVREWIAERFPEAEIEDKTYHGQTRFSLPAAAVLGKGDSPTPASKSAIGRLVVELEENRDLLGIEHFSVSPTTLDKVFLMIVGEHNIKEENY